MIEVKNPGRQPPLVTILATVANVATRKGLTIRVTDTIGNGAHMAWSRHYALSAADLGSKEFAASTKDSLLLALREALGPQYDVILESPGMAHEHIHIEYDPK